MSLWATKSIALLRAEADATGEGTLKKTLGALNLTTLGIGAIIGAGIFVLTGLAAARHAGPAVPLSFVAAGIACAFAGLCYAEMASAVPVAGSAYTYSYATMGEFMAWIIGWDLVLEYAMGASTVGVGWSGYCVCLLENVNIHLPASLTSAPIRWCEASEVAKAVAGCVTPGLNSTGSIVNLPAIAIVAIMSFVLVVGIKESATVNNFIVALKLTVVALFIVAGAFYINPANWHPFIPPNQGEFGKFGFSGVLRGAGLIFFAYIGFDAVSTAAQEAKNPQKDMPKGILGSLAICTVLYILVSGILTGIMPYTKLDVSHPVGFAVDSIPGLRWMGWMINLGAVLGLASVILVMLLGQSRVFYSMSRDGLLPPFVNRVHPKFQTPYITSIVTGVVVAFFSAILPIRDAASLVSIGTLLAFVIVSIGILVLRVRGPNLPRVFRTPAVGAVAPLGALSALYLMVSLSGRTWARLGIWFVIGMVVYFAYGVRHSRLAGVSGPTRPSGPPPA